MVGLGDLPGAPFYSGAVSASADGSTVVGYGNYVSSTSAVATRWVNGVPIGLGLPKGTTSSFATGVSSDGSCISVHSNIVGGGTNAYLWTESSGYQQLPFLTDGTTTGTILATYGISADGSTIVGYGNVTPNASHAYRWSRNRGTESLGDLQGGIFYSAAAATSADGSVVVGIGYNVNGRQSTRWTQATGLVSLGILPGAIDGGDALSTNADGSVVVGQATMPGSTTRAYVWDQHYGMRDLRTVLVDLGVAVPQGWVLRTALDVSADGRTIVGWGTNAQGNFEAYRARLNRVGDATGDGNVNIDDLLVVVGSWGSCPAVPALCAGDIMPLPFGGGDVNIDDLLAVISQWN